MNHRGHGKVVEDDTPLWSELLQHFPKGQLALSGKAAAKVSRQRKLGYLFRLLVHPLAEQLCAVA